MEKLKNEFTFYHFKTVTEASKKGMEIGCQLDTYKEQNSPLWGEIRQAFELGKLYGYILRDSADIILGV